MCGLMAGNGKLDLDIVRSLACQNVSRGRDSAGLAWVEKGEHVIEKVAQHPLVAFNKTLNGAMKRAVDSGIMLGHTRQATQGKINNENAHPFLMAGVAFAHNGIITNHEKFGKYKVDSQALIHGIAKKNFSKYVGSIALVWLEKGILHAYRRGNPLHRGVKDGGLYLASESVFLQRVGCRQIKELCEGVIYTFKDAKVKTTCKVPANQVWAVSAVAPSHYEERFKWNSGVTSGYVSGRALEKEDEEEREELQLGLLGNQDVFDKINELKNHDNDKDD